MLNTNEFSGPLLPNEKFTQNKCFSLALLKQKAFDKRLSKSAFIYSNIQFTFGLDGSVGVTHKDTDNQFQAQFLLHCS